MKKEYDILAVRDYYPEERNPSTSIYVHQQVLGVKKNGLSTIVVSPTPYLPPFMYRNKYKYHPRSHYDIREYEGIDVVRPLFFKIPVQLFYGVSHISLTHSISKKVINRYKVNLIHAHYGQNGAASVPVMKEMKIPLLTSFYGFDSGRLGNKFKKIYQRLIQNGDLFLVLSNDMKKDLLRLNFPEEKIHIHHLGVDVQSFQRKKYSNDKIRFLIVARIEKGKGIQYVIKAISILKEEYPNIELVIVGGGSYLEHLNEMVTSLKLNEYVSFINNFESEDPRGVVLKQMSICDVFLLTTYTRPKFKNKEGTPVVLMEAQACSKPCIATNHAGIPEVVIDEKTGFIVEERDLESIISKMRYLIENEDVRIKLGLNARNHIKQNFNNEVQNQKLVEIYNKYM